MSLIQTGYLKRSFKLEISWMYKAKEISTLLLKKEISPKPGYFRKVAETSKL